VRDQIEAIEERDRALLKLGDLTRACLLAATGLLAFLSVIAAVTIPGQGQPASTQSGSTDDTLTAQVPPVCRVNSAHCGHAAPPRYRFHFHDESFE